MSTTCEPEVSVIVPCYDQGQFVAAALRSIAAATERHHQVVIVDDGSTSRATARALQALRPQAEHQDVKLVSQANAGLAAARNTGLRAAEGRFVQFLDADDLLLRGSIDVRVRRLQSDAMLPPEHRALCLGRYVTLDDAHATLHEPREQQAWPRLFTFTGVARLWERGLSVPIHCALFDRSALSAPLNFEPALRSKEDWLFWMTVLDGGVVPSFVDDLVAVYRLHPNSMTRRSARKNAEAWLLATHMACVRWPERFDETAHKRAMDHFERFYMVQLWREFGPSFPWQVFSAPPSSR